MLDEIMGGCLRTPLRWWLMLTARARVNRSRHKQYVSRCTGHAHDCESATLQFSGPPTRQMPRTCTNNMPLDPGGGAWTSLLARRSLHA